MRSARLDRSHRLQRVLAVLQATSDELSTRAIIDQAGVCAVNSCIAELRDNGAQIICRQVVRDGRRLFFYRLVRAPEIENG